MLLITPKSCQSPITESLYSNEGKLEHTKKAHNIINQNENRETKEQDLDMRRNEDVKTKYRWKEKIKIGVHNINGLKGDCLKLERLEEYCKKEQFNLIRIVKTNINEKKGE